jgi:serine/threonine-protein kinase
MAVYQPMDRRTFVSYLRRSGLVPSVELEPLLTQLSGAGGGSAAARALVERGVLTRFQADRLLAGRSAGFFIGPYRILEQIGRGAVGRVYKAEHSTMRRRVALKLLAPHSTTRDRVRDLFLREVRAMSRLIHPNVVAAFDAGETAGRFYLVLEFVDGPNLDQLVRGEGPLAVERACELIRQAARGLNYAHALRIVHRDIKPSNLLLQRRGLDGELLSQGLVKISDFGLARLHASDGADGDDSGTSLSAENSVVGTPDYLSPEQSRSLHRSDVRSDLYSLGCTFFFLLTGRVPFPGGSTIDKVVRHHTDPVPPVTAERPDVPPAIADVLARLLAKAPEDRFQSAAELAEALAPFCAAGPCSWPVPLRAVLAADTLSCPAARTIDARAHYELDVRPAAAPRAPSRFLTLGGRIGLRQHLRRAFQRLRRAFVR